MRSCLLRAHTRLSKMHSSATALNAGLDLRPNLFLDEELFAFMLTRVGRFRSFSSDQDCNPSNLSYGNRIKLPRNVREDRRRCALALDQLPLPQCNHVHCVAPVVR